ncbi:MAG: hypothetical protein B7Z58_14310 [Acidiphilium sp. 37-64-53]|uniref:envelope stress response membrane protein PspB n=1 Tax=Acidiphilium TaxID=522 RepID=UPI000BC58635|nr:MULTISPECIES: envelope stress response membrane protein PspB [Acidiphilium]OYW00731.1 MAG: hypothetical protein B7Z58_14310 [Acidiphilium sp. 37-64-53]OZB28130.1 MAG: hypothetical protein B7X49_10550 [Acidiphilium sp. 34-64-41]HQT85835.1 envelope stress response membrane protein PspB [Acidiphilium rubrum]
MSSFLALMIPIIAIAGAYGLSAYKIHLRSRGAGLSGADRQLIESLSATAQRLEQRVATLERALLDAETPYSRSTEV